MDYRRQIIAAVGNQEVPVDEAVDATFGLLAAYLSKLPDAEREHLLRCIENGSLRRGVSNFLPATGMPRLGNGHAAGH